MYFISVENMLYFCVDMNKMDLNAAWLQLVLRKEKNLYLSPCRTTNSYIFHILLIDMVIL